MRGTQDLDVLSGSSSASKRRAGRIPRGPAVALATAAVVVLVDQLTKRWAVDRLTAGSCEATPDACIDLFWTARFHLHFNPGAAFSTGESYGRVFGVLAIVMTVVLLSMARGRTDRLGPVLLGAIAGGAVGNLIDRVLRAEDGVLTGTVVDFIDLQWWPIFNVADAAVVVGVIVFATYSVLVPEAGVAADPSCDRDPDGVDASDRDGDEVDPSGLGES